jgi:hypothetical protein
MKRENLKVGGIVKICDGDDWLIGSQVAVYHGDDGVVRVVKLRTARCYLECLVAKLSVILLNDGRVILLTSESQY